MQNEYLLKRPDLAASVPVVSLLSECLLMAEAVSKRKIDRVKSFPSQANFQLKSVAY